MSKNDKILSITHPYYRTTTEGEEKQTEDSEDLSDNNEGESIDEDDKVESDSGEDIVLN